MMNSNTKLTFPQAIKVGDISIVKRFLQIGYRYHLNCIYKVIKYDRFDIFELLIAQQDTGSQDIILSYAVKLSNMKYINYMIERKYICGYDSLRAACSNDDLDMLKYLIANANIPKDFFEDDIIDVFGYVKSVKILRYLHEEVGVRLCMSIFGYCVSSLECCQYLYNEKCPSDYSLFEDALSSGNLDVVKFLYESGFTWDVDFCDQYNEDICKYVHDVILCPRGLCSKDCFRCRDNKINNIIDSWYLINEDRQHYTQWIPQEIIEDTLDMLPSCNNDACTIRGSKNRIMCVCDN